MHWVQPVKTLHQYSTSNMKLKSSSCAVWLHACSDTVKLARLKSFFVLFLRGWSRAENVSFTPLIKPHFPPSSSPAPALCQWPSALENERLNVCNGTFKSHCVVFLLSPQSMSSSTSTSCWINPSTNSLLPSTTASTACAPRMHSWWVHCETQLSFLLHKYNKMHIFLQLVSSVSLYCSQKSLQWHLKYADNVRHHFLCTNSETVHVLSHRFVRSYRWDQNTLELNPWILPLSPPSRTKTFAQKWTWGSS